MSSETNTSNKTQISINQSNISQSVLQLARQNVRDTKKKPVKLSAKEIIVGRTLEQVIRDQKLLQEQQSKTGKSIVEMVAKLQPEANKIMKSIVEQKKQNIANAQAQARQEQAAEIARQNSELQQKMDRYFRNVLKNLPQKGKHTNYTAYIKSFKPITRK
ncbi:MAG: hypothetical protein HQM14_15200 [SAR324 cluster bacterium]|nr:hypothetical protein [SAR324 cluster bacterium]